MMILTWRVLKKSLTMKTTIKSRKRKSKLLKKTKRSKKIKMITSLRLKRWKRSSTKRL